MSLIDGSYPRLISKSAAYEHMFIEDGFVTIHPEYFEGIIDGSEHYWIQTHFEHAGSVIWVLVGSPVGDRYTLIDFWAIVHGQIIRLQPYVKPTICFRVIDSKDFSV